MPIERLGAQQAAVASEALGEAFFDDPLFQIVAPDEATRRRWAPWFMGLTVGTRTLHQGRGLGSALVEVGTARADEAGLPCYLETGTQANIDFYGAPGFTIVGQTELYGHALTGMVRPPRGG